MQCKCEEIAKYKEAIALLQEAYDYNFLEKEHDSLIEAGVSVINEKTKQTYEAKNLDTICSKIAGIDDELHTSRGALDGALLSESYRLIGICQELEAEDREYHWQMMWKNLWGNKNE
ncbi:MAG: hypothetical protein J6J79_07640 [Lachnospiraceae bacterium]|nr:hypothetical protein [Lachnospiraceae bacterium]